MTRGWKYVQYAAALAICTAAVWYIFTHVTDNPRYDLILNSRGQLLKAAGVTLWTSLLTLLFSMIFGFFFYLAGQSRIAFVRGFVRIVREIIMGTPLLVMIFIVVYVVGPLFSVADKLWLGLGR